MIRTTLPLIASLFLGICTSHADDGLGLKRGGNPREVSISGISSGAAMAVQYAVAHSASIVGAGSIAGPGWGCAEGRVSQAINDCMCGRQAPGAKVELARSLAGKGEIDPLVAGKPKALQRSYVFHSAADSTVVEKSGLSSIEFLSAFTGIPPVVDRGNASDGSNGAGHGILSPDGTDSCQASGNEGSYVRRCGTADNAGKLFHAFYGQGTIFDASKRVNNIPASEVWQFDQQTYIDEVKKVGGTIASDRLWFGMFPYKSARRSSFDLAPTGYLYVPPACRRSDSNCRVHVALHGCKQNARSFAATAGYNNWAEHYKMIVVYPAIQPDAPTTGEICQMPAIQPIANSLWIEPNPNGCWDWWGYLDTGAPENRYLMREAPQMQVIERIIAEVSKPRR